MSARLILVGQFQSNWSSVRGVAADSANNIYVANAYTIRKITPAGVVTTLAGTFGVVGSTDGVGAAASFDFLVGVATDSAGNVYVADAGIFTIRKVTSAGAVSTLAGSAGLAGSADGSGAAARFNLPRGVATDSAGNVYVGDSNNNMIRKISPTAAVSTLAGAAGALTGSTDGTATAARFRNPYGVATDGAGNVYVADTGNGTIRRITSAGVVTTFAGNADGFTGSTDGTGTAARFYVPTAVATDSAHNVYVADTNNHTIRKITPAAAVSTLAGSAGLVGSADGSGAAARFSHPYGVATDGAGNVYAADADNSTIRKITPAGAVSTLAGSAGLTGSADGSGVAARFARPFGVATDSAGNIYVADTGNHTIRLVTPAGGVATFAGTAGVVGSTDGVGTAARFNGPLGVATDSAGNVYVSDSGNHTIRKITRGGVVSTVVGVAGQPGFAPGLLPGLLAQPFGIAISGTSLYIVMNNGAALVQNIP